MTASSPSPGSKVGIDLIEKDSNWSLSANVGTWSSFHDSTDTAGDDGRLRGALVRIGHLLRARASSVQNWSFGVVYIWYTSPSDAFKTIGEISLLHQYDDSGLWGESGFALNPSLTGGDSKPMMTAARRIPTSNSGSNRAGSSSSARRPCPVTVPVTLGFGLDDYYVASDGDDDDFGFLQVGLTAGVPLPVDERFGAWTLNAGVHALFLGDAAEEVNEDDDFEVIGTVGVSIGF
jgi:hypothetical protein